MRISKVDRHGITLDFNTHKGVAWMNTIMASILGIGIGVSAWTTVNMVKYFDQYVEAAKLHFRAAKGGLK